jgi:hypothetical protein
MMKINIISTADQTLVLSHMEESLTRDAASSVALKDSAVKSYQNVWPLAVFRSPGLREALLNGWNGSDPDMNIN